MTFCPEMKRLNEGPKPYENRGNSFHKARHQPSLAGRMARRREKKTEQQVNVARLPANFFNI
jgi:hypothetical protein